MPYVDLIPLRGELLTSGWRQKHNVYANCAVNAQFHGGVARPLPCPEEICDFDFCPRTIFSWKDCDCIAFDDESCIDVHNSFVIWADKNGLHKATHEEFCNGQDCKIGIPCPSSPPSVSGGGDGCGHDPRVYFYSYVAKYDDCVVSEGPLSEPSNEIACGSDGASVPVGGFSSPPPGHCITHIRIYRASAGWKAGDDQIRNNSGALLVGEVPVGSGFTDSVPLSATGLVSPITMGLLPMPSDLEGVGVSAFSVFGWKGKELFFSADGMVDVRHPNGRFCFECPIIKAVYCNGVIYVFTERWHYAITERAGEGGVTYSNPPYRFDKIIPMSSIHSATCGREGVYYVTKTGVAFMRYDPRNGAEYGLVPLMNSSQVGGRSFKNAKVFVYQQYLFLFNRDWDESFIFEIGDGTHSTEQYDNISRYPYSISAMTIDTEGCLRFASGKQVYKFMEADCWDRLDCKESAPLCVECCPMMLSYDMKSLVELTDWAMLYLCIGDDRGYVDITYVDCECDNRILYEKRISGCGTHEIRLPGCSRLSKRHQIKVESCTDIHLLRLGTNAKAMGINNQSQSGG